MTIRKAAYVATVYSHLSLFHIPFMKMLESQGFEVHAYANPDHCRLDVEREGFPCRDISFSRNPLSPNNFKALRRLIRIFKQESYDVIHVHTPVAGMVCRIAARIAGVKAKVMYTAHGFHFYEGSPWINWLAYYPVEWMLAMWTDVLVTINREDYKYAKKFPIRGQVAYIPGIGVNIQSYRNVDEDSVEALRDKLELEERVFTVLCIAEFIPRKNHEQLIRAIDALTRQGVQVNCVLAGVGQLEVEMKLLVQALHLDDIVKFAGFRRDIPQLIQLADTVVLLSKQEGLPKALMEAMAAGKPMVVTDVRGSRELVTPFENGFRVSIGDVVGTAQALSELQRSRKLRERMGRSSREKAAVYDLHSIEIMLSKVYAEVVPPSSGQALPDTNGEGMVL